jgi:hypothetical protein
MPALFQPERKPLSVIRLCCTAITYRLPGDLSVTYAGDDKPAFQWVRETWRAGCALWWIWLSCGTCFIRSERRWPNAKEVSELTGEVIKTGLEIMRADAKAAAEPKETTP